MFTECPECGIAFRVTAKVLQQAKGNVRCGGCNHAFNAIEFLSEEMPANVPVDRDDAPTDELAETSRRLLITLDELAGSEDVRIEDTGVEWRVLDDDEAVLTGQDSADQDQVDQDNGEMRYDDNSPLPDEFDVADSDDVDEISLREADNNDASVKPVEFVETHEDLALSEPEEWTDLLQEVGDPELDGPAGDHSGVDDTRTEEPETGEPEEDDLVPESLHVEEEIASIHNELSTGSETLEYNTDIADLESQFRSQAEALGIDLTGSEKALTDDAAIVADSAVPATGLADNADLEQPVTATQNTATPTSDDDALTGAAFDDELSATDVAPLDEEPDEVAEYDLDADPESDNQASLVSDIPYSAGEQSSDEQSNSDYAEEAGLPDDSESADSEIETDDADDDVVARGLESTGEFEAQIEAAAGAFDSIDVDDFASADNGGEADSALDADVEDEYGDAQEDDGSDGEAVAESTDREVTDTPGEQLADAIDDHDAAEDAPAEAAFVSGEQEASKPVAADDELPEQSEAEMTINREIDQEMLAMAVQDDEFSATLVGVTNPEMLFEKDAANVETIIMEGETIHNAIEQERRAAEIAARSQLDDAEHPAQPYNASQDKVRGGRRKYDPPGHNAIAAVAALAFLLVIQLVHNSREALATSALFERTIAPIYRVLGSPVTPKWDIKGWQFEATKGNIDNQESALVVISQLVNRATEALPYPLVHVSVTDRWENVMGSRILEPGEYLAGALDPEEPVQPDENFTAVFSIENPSAEATGFKLNVCYRDGPETVRCAIEDFRN